MSFQPPGVIKVTSRRPIPDVSLNEVERFPSEPKKLNKNLTSSPEKRKINQNPIDNSFLDD